MARSAYNPAANKSNVRGRRLVRRQANGRCGGTRRAMAVMGAGGGRAASLPEEAGYKAGERNVIKSVRPQKPRRCGALGSSSKFSGLDKCRAAEVARAVPRELFLPATLRICELSRWQVPTAAIIVDLYTIIRRDGFLFHRYRNAAEIARLL